MVEATATYKPKVDSGAFCYATHAAVVAVDPENGAVEILDYVIVEDCGTMVNPMIVDGQMRRRRGAGHRHRALRGNALTMRTVSRWRLRSPTICCRARPEMPAMRIVHMETPSPYTEYGIKGMGEGGAIAPPAAIVNAVNDALRRWAPR